MPYGWTAEQLRAAIERCEQEVEWLVQHRARPEEIYHRRQGLDTMRRWLARAEEAEGDA